jgi:hypothetical protein
VAKVVVVGNKVVRRVSKLVGEIPSTVLPIVLWPPIDFNLLEVVVPLAVAVAVAEVVVKVVAAVAAKMRVEEAVAIV